MGSTYGRKISLETAKFLGVPFVICSPDSTAVWRYVHREDGIVLQLQIGTMPEAHWEDILLDDKTMRHAEERYGFVVWEKDKP